MTAKLRLLLADDHPVVRAGLRALIDAQPDLSEGDHGLLLHRVVGRRDVRGLRSDSLSGAKESPRRAGAQRVSRWNGGMLG